MQHFFNPIERKRTSANILKEYLTTWLLSDISNCVLDYFSDDWRPCPLLHTFDINQHLQHNLKRTTARSCEVKNNQACVLFSSYDDDNNSHFTACVYTKHDDETHTHPIVWALDEKVSFVKLLHFNVAAYLTSSYIAIIDLGDISSFYEHEKQMHVPIHVSPGLDVIGFCVHKYTCYLLLTNAEVMQIDLNGDVKSSPFLVSKRAWWSKATNCGANINDAHFFALTHSIGQPLLFLSIFDVHSRTQVFEYELASNFIPAFNFTYFNVTITGTNICTVSCACTYLTISEIKLFRFRFSNSWELFQSIRNFSHKLTRSAPKFGFFEIACIGEELAVTASDSFEIFNCLM